jgi:hypothetical protein
MGTESVAYGDRFVRTKMAACMCCIDQPSTCILVFKWEHLRALSKCLSHIERACCRIHVYCNGFLIVCKSKSVWSLCVDILDGMEIFYQKWVSNMMYS